MLRTERMKRMLRPAADIYERSRVCSERPAKSTEGRAMYKRRVEARRYRSNWTLRRNEQHNHSMPRTIRLREFSVILFGNSALQQPAPKRTDHAGRLQSFRDSGQSFPAKSCKGSKSRVMRDHCNRTNRTIIRNNKARLSCTKSPRRTNKQSKHTN